MLQGSDRHLRYLQTSLARVGHLIETAVGRMRNAAHPQEALRGLVISDDEIDTMLGDDPLQGLWASDAYDPQLHLPAPDSDDEPFLQLVERFDLDIIEAYIILLCLAPDVDRRYERMYGYLQDNVTEPFPTVNLLMNLLGASVPQRFTVRDRLQTHAPLVKYRLVDVAPNPNNARAGFLAWQVRIASHITDFLLGQGTIDAQIKPYVRHVTAPEPAIVEQASYEALRACLPDMPMVFLDGALHDEKTLLAHVVCQEQGIPLIELTLPAPDTSALPLNDLCHLALREATLHQAALLVQGWEHALDANFEPPADWWQLLSAHPLPVFLCSATRWEPQATKRTRRMARFTVQKTPLDLRQRAWQHACDQHDLAIAPDVIEQLASQFRFSPHQVLRAVQSALDIAYSHSRAVIADDLFHGARAHSHLRLGKLASSLEPRHDWDDLILPPDQIEQLRELQARAQYAGIVTEEWGFGRKNASATGISALFAGESGTGKTLAAEVLARHLGMVIYKIDLSSVVSKYIGETEKNLNTIFTEAQHSNVILFFDEADALFGKRSEVKDARDRYANIEVAYLLQKIEEYDGIAIMATNLRQNLDEAFTRRLDFLIDFPFPEPEYRERIWHIHFPKDVEIAPDIDLRDLAKRYNLAGGNIKNVVLAAAFLAVADGGVITAHHLHHAVRREHQKMGRLFDEDYQRMN